MLCYAAFFYLYKRTYDASICMIMFVLYYFCLVLFILRTFSSSLCRYEIGRYSPQRWMDWNQNLERIIAQPGNVIAANNLFDLEYIRYFTSIPNVLYLPSLAGYVTDRYNPTQVEILVAPSRGVAPGVWKLLQRFSSSTPSPLASLFSTSSSSSSSSSSSTSSAPAKQFTFSPIRDLYRHYEYVDLARHPAIVLLPYQVSFMSFFEFYRMGVPLFAPSVRLLARWHIEHHMLHEKTWNSVFGRPMESEGALSKHPRSHSALQSDPNDDVTYASLIEWLPLADYYVYPCVQTFDTLEELMTKLSTVNFHNVSACMLEYITVLTEDTRRKWDALLGTAARRKREIMIMKGDGHLRVAADDRSNNIQARLKSIYDIDFDPDNCDST